MCYRKKTIYTRCHHATTEDQDCEAQKRQTHLERLRRLSGTTTASRRSAASWLHFFFFCCFPAVYSSPTRTPPPTARNCWLEDVAVEVDGVCPRCRLWRAQERAVVDRRHRYDEHEPARRRRAGVGAFADPSCGQEREGDVRMRDAERYGESGRRSRRGYRQEDVERIQAPERAYRPYRAEEPRGRHDGDTMRSPRRPGRDFVPYVDPPAPVVAPSSRTTQLRNQDSTSHFQPAPLQVSNVKQNQDFTKNRSKSNNQDAPRRTGRSAIGGLQNPPMSVLVEDVEKTWSRDPPAAATAGTASSSRHAPTMSPAPYTPDLPVEELIDEVELLWQMSTSSGGSGSGRS
ncbi:hypothetical protein CkaCkLH20_03333 [Colletotrichum karsti]|uniref:Uncharacterized protein n=1 Tax=Colletotrichum karsti TaxID=1095194 RepID=A0A9P6IHI8_9PEZI|nr:uncharacterized protein CkaCkLH20_03333 [Colletotrichum karsti]KAF9879100.1 hypothetical protein CkaCkLH20_03333 [Colletotrichum karsti]